MFQILGNLVQMQQFVEMYLHMLLFQNIRTVMNSQNYCTNWFLMLIWTLLTCYLGSTLNGFSQNCVIWYTVIYWLLCDNHMAVTICVIHIKIFQRYNDWPPNRTIKKKKKMTKKKKKKKWFPCFTSFSKMQTICRSSQNPLQHASVLSKSKLHSYLFAQKIIIFLLRNDHLKIGHPFFRWSFL